jgi:hypothetical protein
MIDLTDKETVAALKGNLHACFDSPQGKEAMKFIEQVGSWHPTIMDSMDTNAIVARDANRRLIGTIKTMLDLSVEQIVQLSSQ